MRIDKVYTRVGDQGETSLIGGERVSKAEPRLECYGTVDEVNATLGLVRTALEASPAGPHLALLGFPFSSTASYPDVPGDSDPDYSPTGKRVVFNHYSWIYTSDADGGHRRHLVQGYHPDWQPVFD